MRIIFVSSLDSKRFHEIHAKSDNIEIMNGTETTDIINEFLNLFLEDIKKDQEQK